jgi:hypothetical protein
VVDTLSVTGTGPRTVQFGNPNGTADPSQMDRSFTSACFIADAPHNQWGYSAQILITPHSGNGPWQKAAIYGLATTQKANTPGNNYVDAIGGLFQGWINGQNPRGRAWGSCLEASVGEDSNGLLFGSEIGLYFPTSKENPNHRDEEFSKSNIWLAAGSPGRASAGIKFGNLHGSATASGGWFVGVAIQHTVNKGIELANPVHGSGGIIFDNSPGWGESLRIPNNSPVTAYTADGQGVVGLFFMSGFNQLVMGQGANGIVMFLEGRAYNVEMGPPDAQGYRNLRVKA